MCVCLSVDGWAHVFYSGKWCFLKGKIWEIEKNVVLLLRERIGNYFVGVNGVKTYAFVGVFTKQHALKGQKLLAQGNALGIKAISKSPCKGKSFTNCPWSFKAFALTGRQVCEQANPGRCPGLRASAPSGRAACGRCPGLRASAPSIIFALGKIKR